MSTTKIPDKVRELLFGYTAGRCEYRGCNRLLTEDDLTWKKGKFSVFAHIIADEPNGPRGDPILSPALAKDITNLMLLCEKHHKLIDIEDVPGHPVELLREHKQQHEERIRRLTDIDDQHRTFIVMMEANIGERKGLIDSQQARAAVLPRYPEDEIEINLGHTRLGDGVNWPAGTGEIDATAVTIQDRLVRGKAKHLSIFAVAPIPLLMHLGRRLGDLSQGEAFQCRRNPPGWDWLSPTGTEPEFKVEEAWQPILGSKQVALILSISDEVDVNLVRAHAGTGVDGYLLRVEEPRTDLIRSRDQTVQFRTAVRQFLPRLRARHGADVVIHVYPALPNSLAVEFGRALLPKTDSEMRIYDLNRFSKDKGWAFALQLLPPLTEEVTPGSNPTVAPVV